MSILLAVPVVVALLALAQSLTVSHRACADEQAEAGPITDRAQTRPRTTQSVAQADNPRRTDGRGRNPARLGSCERRSRRAPHRSDCAAGNELADALGVSAQPPPPSHPRSRRCRAGPAHRPQHGAAARGRHGPSRTARRREHPIVAQRTSGRPVRCARVLRGSDPGPLAPPAGLSRVPRRPWLSPITRRTLPRRPGGRPHPERASALPAGRIHDRCGARQAPR